MASGRKSIGVFTTDRSLVIQSWDPWMAEATGIPEAAACGEPLARLYPELAERGLLARLRRVADGVGVEVLAPALHKYFLPCPPRDRASGLEWMRQHVTLAPLRNYDGIAGVIVTIKDVTPRFDRARRLAADLDSPDESIRLRAVTELARERQSPLLLSSALGDESWRVRRAAAEGMSSTGGPDIVGTLVEALRDHHRDPALLNAAVTALAQATGDAVTAIIPLLDLADADVRTYAALALGLMDDGRAVPALVDRLYDDDVNVRFHVIEALGRLGDWRAADSIAAIAATGDFFLGFAALDALAAIGDPSVASLLLPLLDDALLMPAAANCLGAIGSEVMAVPLALLTRQSSVAAAPIALAIIAIHARTAQAMGEGGVVAELVQGVMTRESANALTTAISDAGVNEVCALATMLSWLPFDGIDETLARLLGHEAARETVPQLLASRGVTAAPHVEAMAREGDAEVRHAAAVALGRIGSSSSIPLLTEMTAAEEETDVVIAAAGALGAIGDQRAFPPLLALMDHAEATVRQAAVAALSSIGHPKTEAAIAGRLSDPSPRVRESAARVAGYFGYDSCLRQMVELCDDADPVVRRAAVVALANYDQRPAWSKIHETIATDPDATVRAAGVRALAQSRSGETDGTLIRALRDSGLWVRYYAARTAGRRRPAHADLLTAVVECALRDLAIPVRIAAVESLGALEAVSMVEVLVALARDLEPEVSAAALTALGHFPVPASLAPLLFALEESAPQHQMAALDALGQQGAAAGPAVPSVVQLARTTRDDEVRANAVRVLGRIGDEQALQALISLIVEHRFRAPVADALAAVPGDRLPILARALPTVHDVARELIVDAVGRMTDPAVGRFLAVALQDPAPKVGLAAARGLERLDLRTARQQLATIKRAEASPPHGAGASGVSSRE